MSKEIKLRTDREWLMKMAEKDDGCPTSVGGLWHKLDPEGLKKYMEEYNMQKEEEKKEGK